MCITSIHLRNKNTTKKVKKKTLLSSMLKMSKYFDSID
jgi:hypothetical protein